MKIKRILQPQLFITALILLLNLHFANGQDYKTGIGLRGGIQSGLTIKHFTKETAAIEGIVNPYRHGFNVTGLYEIHAKAFNTQEISWFYGGGAHIGIYNGYYYGDKFYKNRINDPNYGRRNYVNIGIDGIIGLEYKITEIPFTIGVDLKPYIDLIYWGDNYLDAALSVRYYW